MTPSTDAEDLRTFWPTSLERQQFTHFSIDVEAKLGFLKDAKLLRCVKTPNEPERDSAFPETTHSIWMNVKEAGAGSSEAVRQLCERYHEPICNYARRLKHNQYTAEELASNFFQFLLTRNRFSGFVKGSSKFRSFLITCLKNFDVDLRRKASSISRGGGIEPLSLDDIDPAEDAKLQSGLDRDIALAIHNRIIAQLAGKHEPLLISAAFADKQSYKQIASRLGLADGTLRVQVFRIRRAYASQFRADV